MNNHVTYCSLSSTKTPILEMARFIVIIASIELKHKKLLTNKPYNFSIKSLTKTSSGKPLPKDLAVFLRLLYGGSRVPNTIPFMGNKHRRLDAVSEACHPYLNGVALSKLNHLGVHHA